VSSGPWRQVSRLGNPLVNEVINPLGKKDLWNTLPPSDDKRFAEYVTHPGLAALLPTLYPGVFPELATLVASGKPRADLEAILLTGIPKGIVPGFTNYTGPVLADMLRLNTSIPPTPTDKQSIYGLLGGDALASRTGAGCVTTSSRSSCGRWPASPTRWSTRATRPTRPRASSPTGSPRECQRLVSRLVPLPRGSVQRLLQPV